jgi:hypothetical protein
MWTCRPRQLQSRRQANGFKAANVGEQINTIPAWHTSGPLSCRRREAESDDALDFVSVG